MDQAHTHILEIEELKEDKRKLQERLNEANGRLKGENTIHDEEDHVGDKLKVILNH